MFGQVSPVREEIPDFKDDMDTQLRFFKPKMENVRNSEYLHPELLKAVVYQYRDWLESHVEMIENDRGNSSNSPPSAREVHDRFAARFVGERPKEFSIVPSRRRWNMMKAFEGDTRMHAECSLQSAVSVLGELNMLSEPTMNTWTNELNE